MSLKIKAKNYLAVKSAEIDLSGITVISGINGSGKSTIAHSTYKLLDKALNYNPIVDKEVSEKIFVFLQTLSSAADNLIGLIPRSESQKIREPLHIFSFLIGRLEFSTPEKKKADILHTINLMFHSIKEIKEPKTEKQSNQYKAFLTLLSNLADNKNNEQTDIDGIFLGLHKKIESIFSLSETKKSERPISSFQNSWKADFKKALDPNVFNVEENNVPIIDTERNLVSLPDSVKKVIYIDSPMSFGERNSRRDHWNELNNLFKSDLPFGPMFDYNSKDSLGILNGSFEWNDQKTSITYTLPNGVSFDLFENGATGLKSFSILQLLFREGYIGKKTLLIMDEPEAHLHPQWIIHFARFIVLLRKVTGCRFLISSHSTDMISAIKYISKKELDQEAIFYSAELIEESDFKFEYKFLDHDIEPIFDKFNKSFELTDNYSEIQE